MKRKTSKTKAGSKTALVWHKHPEGGEYASYKLGTVFRYKGKYSYRTSYNRVYNASSLTQAKLKIDAYTKERISKK